MDFQMSDEHQMIVDTATKLAQKYNRDYILKCAETNSFPQEMWDELGELGYLGMTIPEDCGGAGLGMQELSLLQETLSEYGVGLPFFVINQGLTIPCVAKHGSEEQKQRILPSIASGEKKFCFAITEPNAGTNTFKIETTAKRDGDDYIINGSKLFISGVNHADYMFLVTRNQSYDEVGGKANRKQGFCLFMIDPNMPGVEYKQMDTQLGNLEHQFFVYFDDLRVSKDALLGEEGKGIYYLFDALNPERIMVSAGSLGTGRYALKKAVDYANQRVIFDRPISAYQGLQHPMAEAKAELELASLLLRKAAWEFDNGLDAAHTSNMAKLVASDAGFKACDSAIQCFGGYGFTESQDMISLWKATRLMKSAPVNRQMNLNYIAQHVLGMPQSY